MQGMVAAANQDPRLTRVFSTFTASNPSIWLDIDREKAQALGLVDLRRVQRAADDAGWLLRQRLQPVRPHLAGQHPGRRGRSQRRPAAIYKIYVRNNGGEMVPLRSIANVRIALGPQVISRYNNYRSVTINGSPQAGRVVRRCADGDDAALTHDTAAGLQLRVDRHGVSGARGNRADRVHSGAGGVCSPTCSWWRCTKAG